MAKCNIHVSRGSLIVLLNLFGFFIGTNALYEDQAGKFDWRKSFVGKTKYADFESNKLIVATDENVLACLNVKTGAILWRQQLENSLEQQVQLFKVDKEITTVSGGKNSWYIRGWEINSGILLWEWIVNSEKPYPISYWTINNKELFHVVPYENSHIEVTAYHIESGETRRKTSTIPTPWLRDSSKCVGTKKLFVCVTEELIYVDLSSGVTTSKSIDFNQPGEADLLEFKSEYPSVLVTKNSLAKIVHFKNEVEISTSTYMPNVISIQNGNKNQYIQLDINTKNPDKLLRVNNGEEFFDVEYPKGLGAPYILSGQCKSTCDLLLTTTDHALILVKIPDGRITWTREEALSDIIATEFFELPVSEMDASIENEFKTSSNDILSMFIHRISTQTKQLSNLLFGSKLMLSNTLVRDDFGLHKIIVVVTRVGKLFAIDTLSGHIVWSYRLPRFRLFNQDEENEVKLFVQRTARYSPLPAQCTLLAQDDLTGETIFFQFDPITGSSARGIIRLPERIKQASLLPFEDNNHLKPFVTVNHDNTVNVYPKEAENLVVGHLNSIYLYMANQESINGFSLRYIGRKLKAVPHWNFHFAPSKLSALSTRPAGEKVHSQGRVLPDRSVYYKYVNPNLIAVATISDDPVHKQVLSIYLIDGITGFVIHSLAHKRARGPISLVHSENWLVYTFFNERYRRTELAALELYEGHIQSNSTYFSSYAMSHLPQVSAQSYILPAAPIKLAVTLTERGITNKFLLVALNNGAVVEIPWALVQPRFADIPCGPEESCYPYMPEIPLHPEATINYNQTLYKVKGISVAPARLESTSHVLVYGLDMFYTRVAPSKTFDVLKEDFDHELIVLVLIGLVVASYISKHLASKKAIKQAWK